VIERPIEELIALGAQPSANAAPRQDIEVFLRLIKSHQLPELRRHLSQTLARQGLQRFVTETVAPLNIAVGDAWMRGFLAVFEEHLYTELMQNALRNAVSALQSQGRTPRVLLTSLPNDLHNLGLLMVEAVLCVEGASCIPLGTETPLGEIVTAAQAQRADIVALSFSAAYSEVRAAEGLRELRALLPGQTALCAGGAAVQRIRKPIEGVRLVGSLEEMVEVIKEWRAERFVY
jgi:methanogenic corrinoid protein MtbC1